ncbi:MAG: sulfotransferase [bacterium]|nr:sulfotransferase [bacterium]
MNITAHFDKKPDFFVAGMPRSGTTSMYTYLKQHPEIFLAIYKEPNFFSKDLTQSHYNVEDETLYASLFKGADKKRVGEGSVWYLTSTIAAPEIKSFNREAKIVVMLRNPVDMIYSLHSLYVRTGNDDEPDFEKSLQLQPERMKGAFIPGGCYFPEGLYYTEIAKYYDKIKRFMDIFGKENIHIVLFDDFANNTAQSYADTLRFLEVDPDFRAVFDLKKASSITRSLVVHQLRDTDPEIKKKLSNKTGLRAHQGPKRSPLTDQLRSHLSELFREDLEKTGQLTGKDLSHWSKR